MCAVQEYRPMGDRPRCCPMPADTRSMVLWKRRGQGSPACSFALRLWVVNPSQAPVHVSLCISDNESLGRSSIYPTVVNAFSSSGLPARNLITRVRMTQTDFWSWSPSTHCKGLGVGISSYESSKKHTICFFHSSDDFFVQKNQGPNRLQKDMWQLTFLCRHPVWFGWRMHLRPHLPFLFFFSALAVRWCLTARPVLRFSHHRGDC